MSDVAYILPRWHHWSGGRKNLHRLAVSLARQHIESSKLMRKQEPLSVSKLESATEDKTKDRVEDRVKDRTKDGTKDMVKGREKDRTKDRGGKDTTLIRCLPEIGWIQQSTLNHQIVASTSYFRRRIAIKLSI